MTDFAKPTLAKTDFAKPTLGKPTLGKQSCIVLVVGGWWLVVVFQLSPRNGLRSMSVLLQISALLPAMGSACQSYVAAFNSSRKGLHVVSVR